ncbi:MAG TPA: cyclic nucleotide-binding domain-containing protein [Candidatus Acidoferrales bacterium]|nr:cyclic nucleotide-binding domain-containing protein [Candidatus Acidoferrales bacterium]HXR33837.1 cyclic nucleotide-binding domain-containing protein [Verrucomicrobiae bacterium]
MSATNTTLVELTIDGKLVQVPAGTTVYDAARVHGIAIPTLCHLQNQTPVGVCRLCVVDTGARVLSAACVRPVEPGMKVSTKSEKVLAARKTLLELLMADHPSPCARQKHSGDCELETLAKAVGVGTPRFPRRTVSRGADDSSLAIAVDHDACILCDRCIRGCDEIKSNFVLGRMGKGYSAGIAFDLNSPMGDSTCISCGECMVSCPTGALTNKGVVGTAIAAGRDAQSLTAEELHKLPVFAGVSGTFLELNRGAIVERRYNTGEVICREGEFGSTAFYILEGKAQVVIATPIAHVKTQGGAQGFFKRLTSVLVGREQDRREEEARDRTIPIDASVDLSYGNPVAELGPGDLFGEMTCMNFYPRSATVRAESDVVAFEMLRNVLDIMMKNKTFRAQIEQNYRRRALETHLRGVPMFAELSPDFIEHLKESVELVRYAPGQVIARQGDAADSFYLVRIGFVKISEEYPGGELVLAYLSRGDYFGEIGLLGGGVRTATCTALDHVEVVKISGDDFRQMVERFPSVRVGLEAVAAERRSANAQRMQMVHSVPIEQFLSQGLMEAQSLLILDLQKCTRCDACVNACADAHDGVTRLVREGLRFENFLVATSCRQCRDPLCMVGCPVGSIRRRNSLEVIIEDWCIGCGLCAQNCPYGNINLHPFEIMAEDPEQAGRRKAVVQQKATSCDLCTHLKEPSCVYACPHDAAHRVDPRKFFAGMMGPEPKP